MVDPTKRQFQLVFRYEELDLDDPATRELVPTGKCPNCGGPCYEGKSICSKKCEEDYTRYLNNESGRWR